jgi:glycosyltransferase involved in cell wall biosynthesis
MKKLKLAIITSHPIQYNAPLFKMLVERDKIGVKVFYTWGETVLENKFDPGFGRVVNWDIPLLEGYEYEFLKNTAREKGSDHFRGIVNPEIISRVDAYEPDGIMVFGWAFQSHLKVMRHYKNKKLILFRGDSTLLYKFSFIRKQLRKFFLRRVYRNIDYALYVGKNNYQYFKQAGLRDDQLQYAPHAVDNKRFSKNDAIREEEALYLRKNLNIDEQEIVFLFAGKLEIKKDVKSLLAAFEQTGLYRSTHLVIVGNGKLEQEFKKNYGSISSVHFVDFQNQSQMPAIYRLGDIFVLPSDGPETWGLAVNEAMACGRAVLVSDICGCGIDLVDVGKNGFIFHGGNVKDLGEKMLTLAEIGKSGIKLMGQYSGVKIEKFSFERFCESTENILLK